MFTRYADEEEVNVQDDSVPVAVLRADLIDKQEAPSDARVLSPDLFAY